MQHEIIFHPHVDSAGGMSVEAMGLALLLKAACAVPAWEYALLLAGLMACVLYWTLDFHLFQDLRSGFRGHPVKLLHSSSSPLASHVLPHCQILKQRYVPTPWLCSPHLQTAFLHFFGRPPQFEYQRQVCCTPDGGTIALDWLNPNDMKSFKDGESGGSVGVESCDETCIVVVIPGLTSDSADSYVKHTAYSLASSGWRVVVANHRGLGGVSITSDQFYSAGWTEDLRMIINRLHQTYPKAPLFAVGTSLGANILVKYLGEDGESTPLGGAAAICCPWDLLVCDRFICRKAIQRIYNKVLTFSLRSYAELHQVAISRFADWDLIRKCRSIRDFDNYCTRHVGQHETVDTYYRKCSSAFYLHSVSIPIFCVSSLDDPVCTKEAIPWDECRVNANVVLGLTRNGGHLGFFEGFSARTIWWVRATTEFLENLKATSILQSRKHVLSDCSPLMESDIEKSPYLQVSANNVIGVQCKAVPERLISAEDQSEVEGWKGDSGLLDEQFPDPNIEHGIKDASKPHILSAETSRDTSGGSSSAGLLEDAQQSCHQQMSLSTRGHSNALALESTIAQLSKQVEILKEIVQEEKEGVVFSNALERKRKKEWPLVPAHISKQMVIDASELRDEGSGRTSNIKHGSPTMQVIRVIQRQNRWTLWLLAYVAVVTTWPLVGSALFLSGKGGWMKIVIQYWTNRPRALAAP